MQAIRSVFAAFTNLAASVNALASVLDLASGRIRQQRALDGEPAATVLEYHPADNAEPDAAPAKGRKAKASA